MASLNNNKWGKILFRFCCDAMVSKGASRTRGIEFESVDHNDLQYHPIALTMEPGVVERPVVLHAKNCFGGIRTLNDSITAISVTRVR